jgi:hypothetical protein
MPKPDLYSAYFNIGEKVRIEAINELLKEIIKEKEESEE